MKSFLKLFALCTIAALQFGVAYELGQRLQEARDNASLRQLAIDNNCGGYDFKTGEFGWHRAWTDDEIVTGSSSLREEESIHMPVPGRKPKVQK